MAGKASKKTTSAKVEKTNVEQNARVNTPQPDANDSTQLTVSDLQTLAQAIDIASRRGAYGASEMGSVGAIYNKLTGFLQLIAEQRKAQEGGDK